MRKVSAGKPGNTWVFSALIAKIVVVATLYRPVTTTPAIINAIYTATGVRCYNLPAHKK